MTEKKELGAAGQYKSESGSSQWLAAVVTTSITKSHSTEKFKSFDRNTPHPVLFFTVTIQAECILIVFLISDL